MTIVVTATNINSLHLVVVHAHAAFRLSIHKQMHGLTDAAACGLPDNNILYCTLSLFHIHANIYDRFFVHKCKKITSLKLILKEDVMISVHIEAKVFWVTLDGVCMGRLIYSISDHFDQLQSAGLV